MQKFDGDSPDDRKLWHTYLFLARKHAISSGGKPTSTQPPIIEHVDNRVAEPLAEALQTVLFSSFALEYRLKRAFLVLGVPLKPNETLNPLFDRFWHALKNVDRLDGKGKCAPPLEWQVCQPKLKQLISLRNQMAHANYGEVLIFLGGQRSINEAGIL